MKVYTVVDQAYGIMGRSAMIEKFKPVGIVEANSMEYAMQQAHKIAICPMLEEMMTRQERLSKEELLFRAADNPHKNFAGTKRVWR